MFFDDILAIKPEKNCQLRLVNIMYNETGFCVDVISEQKMAF